MGISAGIFTDKRRIPTRALTDRYILSLKPTGKSSKHFDGGGMYLFLSATGGKLWRLVYRFEGKEK